MQALYETHLGGDGHILHEVVGQLPGLCVCMYVCVFRRRESWKDMYVYMYVIVSMKVTGIASMGLGMIWMIEQDQLWLYNADLHDTHTHTHSPAADPDRPPKSVAST